MDIEITSIILVVMGITGLFSSIAFLLYYQEQSIELLNIESRNIELERLHRSLREEIYKLKETLYKIEETVNDFSE